MILKKKMPRIDKNVEKWMFLHNPGESLHPNYLFWKSIWKNALEVSLKIKYTYHVTHQSHSRVYTQEKLKYSFTLIFVHKCS